ncbi:uncharacterized protein LOC126263178 isoform X3 [Schistocerca nitens]|uniref:uncharacterized protein LOC126263178 isoform X3 n=1 Tax=Schistocerca nitens TaxID=7011 RepID=UPI0021184932|nr:uncharacterized protein LOC126263178 isoform X3 [Schistocerca nitens]
MELTNEKYKFAIIKFPAEDDALGIIALCWIQNDGTTCLYPPVTTDSKRNKLLREEALPLQSWSSHKISLMKKYATYNDAREHFRKAEETSNLESEEEIGVKRKRKAKDIMLPGEESSDEDYMPKKKYVERIWLILGQLQAAARSQSEEISQLNRKIDLLLARGCVNSTYQEADESNEQALNSLPLSSMEEFDEFEEKLKQQEFKSLVVKLLAPLVVKMQNC